ncbi:MAG: nucleotide-binding protein [Bacteroidales bacterium]|nr:nucleotide-binding protein [Bacteroidales bacterium]
MGTHHVETCHITGLPTENHPSEKDLAEYYIEVNDERLLLRFNWDHQNSAYVQRNKHILYGMLLNKVFPEKYIKNKSEILDNEKLEEIINDAIYPKTPDDKLNNLLNYLHSLQWYEGSEIKWPSINDEEKLANMLYFFNNQELSFYLFTLYYKGLISGMDASTFDGSQLIDVKLTYEGLLKIVEINESGAKSKKCFIAMSFSNSQKDKRVALKEAIDECGYSPIIIDEQHIDSEITINDAMIAEIKKSKFIVADFTEHKHGVYFEAGFALGLKKPVIYTCEKSHFEKTHFDTNHYPHIVYEDLGELKDKLAKKIEAWIG